MRRDQCMKQGIKRGFGHGTRVDGGGAGQGFMIIAILTSYIASVLWVLSVDRRASLGSLDQWTRTVRGPLKLAALLSSGCALVMLNTHLPLETAIPLWCVVILLSALLFALTISLWPGARAASLLVAAPLLTGFAVWGLS